MSIDPSYLEKFILATEKAAFGASLFIGKEDKIAADKGAVDLMRKELNKINMELLVPNKYLLIMLLVKPKVIFQYLW